MGSAPALSNVSEKGTDRAGLTVRLNVLSAVERAASVVRIWKTEVPTVVGVPVTALPTKFRPAGKVPEEMDQA